MDFFPVKIFYLPTHFAPAHALAQIGASKLLEGTLVKNLIKESKLRQIIRGQFAIRAIRQLLVHESGTNSMAKARVITRVLLEFY